MMRKIGQMVKSMVSIASDDEADGLKGDYDDETTMIEEQERLISLRENLVAAIATNEASSDIVKNLVESGTDDFRMKYAMLDVKQLLEINSQSMINLQNIVSGLSLIAKYAQNLLKQDQPIQSIPLSNPHVQKKIVPFKGSMYILGQLGYSHQTEKALSFPPDTDPDHRIIVNLLADMLLFKAEMRYFLTGSHKDSQQIEALLPSHTLAELHGGDGSSQEFLDTSVQSLDLDKTKTSGSDSSSVYYSAQSGGSSNKDSLSEFSPKEGTLHEEEEDGMLPEEVEGAESKPLQRPKEIVTMQDYAVEEIGGSDTSSLKTPSSGFKLSCTLCNEEAQTLCRACQNKLLCNACDTDWHSHWARQNHDRELISDLDPNALPSVSDNIVRGVYGIIAQTENPVALISKKIQAAASKSKDAHDGEPGEDKNGNVPDFGSIMSGNLEPFADDRTKNSQQQQQQQQQQNPKLLTRGGSEEKKVFKDRGGPAARGFGPPQVWQQQQQQHQQLHGELNQQPVSPLQQHDLPQFLQEGGGSGGVGGNNKDNNLGDVQYHPYPQALQQHQQYQYYNNPPLPPTSSVPMSMQPPSPFSSTYPIPQSQPWLVHSQSAAPRAQSQPIVSVAPGQQPIYMQGQNALPGQGPVPSVSNPLVHSHPSGIYGPVPYRAPYAQSPGQPMNMTSKGHVDPLPHQIPPVSSSQNFQQFGGDLNYNQSSSSAAEHVYSMTQQQQQQQQQQPLFRPPTNVQVYNANIGQWRHYTPEYRPSTTPVGEPQRWYHSSNQNQDNPPDSSPMTARHKVASNSWDVMGPHHHQSMPQQYQQQAQQQQQGLPQSHLQNYPDKEETFVQYPSQSRMPTPMTNNMPYQIPQVQSTQFAPKQSQTYPQLSTIATASLNEEQSRPQPQQQRQQQQQQQKASRKLLHTSQSTPALSSASNPAAKIILRIKSEPLASTRQSLCSFKIDELTGEIDDLSKEIDDHLLDDDDAALSTQIEVLTKRKKELLKTKKELVKYFREIENSADDSLEVFFPPSSGSSLQQVRQQSLPVSLAERASSGMRRTPTKEIPEVGVENVARVESAKILSKKSDVQAGHHQHQHQHHRHSPPLLSEPSFPGAAESTVENASHKQPSPPRMEPPQISLKEDKSSPESSSKLKWYCGHCTYLNDVDSQHCVLCHKTTDHKKYYREDGNEETMESEQLVPDLQDGNRGSPQQNDFVAEVVARNRILSMQKEEEKMMAEKKKAWEEFKKEGKEASQGSTIESSPNGANNNKRNKTSAAGTTPLVSEARGGGAAAAASATTAGFSELSAGTTGYDTTSGVAGGSGGSQSSTSMCATSALERLKEAHACDSLKKGGQMLVGYMKEADKAGYPVDAVPIALSFYDAQTTTVLDWLAGQWEKNLVKIIKEVTDVAARREQNNIGQLSRTEAEVACIKCLGNLKHAVDECIRQREELFNHLNAIDNYPREEILQAMYNQQGDKGKAEEDLVRAKLNGFVERIWSKEDPFHNILYPAMKAAPLAAAGAFGHGGEHCVSKSSSALEQDTFRQLIADEGIDRDRRIRMILVEGKLKSWGRGQMVIDILDKEKYNEHVDLDDIVEAVRNCRDTKSALAFLKHECQICFDDFPMGKIRNLSCCQCKLCVGCLTGNFLVVIKEKHVRHWTCPICELPDMNDEEKSLDYLNILQMLLNPIVPRELMNLFEDKIRDFTLQKDPCFRWCAHCGNGFLAEINGPNGAMTCNICHKKTCFNCKRMWEPQHNGLTCEQFDQWKIDNDPSNQAIGLARHLEENGIDCPKCNMRYSLAKGGCMHFKCPQCGHEFCSGCYENYNQKGVCKKYKSCLTLGFHCHHPRDCFSYLRDNTVEALQELLQMNNVPFNIQVPEDQEDKRHCPVMEQKEDGTLKKDEMCGKNVEFDMAGLCPSHYKEYLTGLINKHALDPAQLMNVEAMVQLLKRFDMDAPSRAPTDTDENSKAKLMKIIQEKLPLNRKKPVVVGGRE